MRYLKVAIIILAYSLITPAFADVCCPSGCVPTYAYNSTACVYAGTQNFCGYGSTGNCGGGGGRPSGGGSSSGTVRGPANPVGPQCFDLTPTNAEIVAATNKCVNQLIGSAQFFGCLFEDDAGKAEDARTGLSCPDREAALARQCRNRCAAYASASLRVVCQFQDPNDDWQLFFKDIGGFAVGSARVDLCGPRLPMSAGNRLRVPSQRYHP
jgi:hypothetical protein